MCLMSACNNGGDVLVAVAVAVADDDDGDDDEDEDDDSDEGKRLIVGEGLLLHGATQHDVEAISASAADTIVFERRTVKRGICSLSPQVRLVCGRVRCRVSYEPCSIYIYVFLPTPHFAPPPRLFAGL